MLSIRLWEGVDVVGCYTWVGLKSVLWLIATSSSIYVSYAAGYMGCLLFHSISYPAAERMDGQTARWEGQLKPHEVTHAGVGSQLLCERGRGPASKPCKRLEAESQEGACVVPMRLCVWAEETAVRREIVKRTVTSAHVVLVGT